MDACYVKAEDSDGVFFHINETPTHSPLLTIQDMSRSRIYCWIRPSTYYLSIESILHQNLVHLADIGQYFFGLEESFPLIRGVFQYPVSIIQQIIELNGIVASIRCFNTIFDSLSMPNDLLLFTPLNMERSSSYETKYLAVDYSVLSLQD